MALTRAVRLRPTETIFVAIPSFEDSDCFNTIKNLFIQARDPHRISVGVCDQWRRPSDRLAVQTSQFDRQVRIVEFPSYLSKGVWWARSQARQLLADESFFLQCDSHMRFCKHWDDKLLLEVQKLTKKRGLLSTYPPQSNDDGTIPAYCNMLVATGFNSEGILKFGSRSFLPQPAAHTSIKGALAAGCFLFGPTEALRALPDEVDILSREEPLLGLFLWCMEWNFFVPAFPLLTHNWRRPTRFLTKEGVGRARRLLQHDSSMTFCEIDRIRSRSGRYSRITRSAEEYELFSGINFGDRSISIKASLGEW